MSLLPVEEAIGRILAGVSPLPAETVDICEAYGRFLAEDLAAGRSQPPFPASAMDGYAVRAEDAGEGARLKVIGTSAAGHGFAGSDFCRRDGAHFYRRAGSGRRRLDPHSGERREGRCDDCRSAAGSRSGAACPLHRAGFPRRRGSGQGGTPARAARVVTRRGDGIRRGAGPPAAPRCNHCDGRRTRAAGDRARAGPDHFLECGRDCRAGALRRRPTL